MNLINLNLKQNRKSQQRAEKITRSKNRDWYSIKNAKEDRAEVFIFDEIGFWGVTAQSFISDFKEITAKNVDLRINSPGGAVFEGMAIFNAIKRHPANVTVHVEALAASIAAVIAMAGDSINMAKNSHMMIHKAFTISMGNAEDLRKEADVLDRIDDTIAEIFVERTDESKGDIINLMEDETWMNAQEALDMGFIDTVEGDSGAENKFDLTVFNHVPQELLAIQNKRIEEEEEKKFSKTGIEKILRNAGVPKSKAKAVVAKGYDRAGLRNVDQNDRSPAVDDILVRL